MNRLFTADLRRPIELCQPSGVSMRPTPFGQRDTALRVLLLSKTSAVHWIIRTRTQDLASREKGVDERRLKSPERQHYEDSTVKSQNSCILPRNSSRWLNTTDGDDQIGPWELASNRPNCPTGKTHLHGHGHIKSYRHKGRAPCKLLKSNT